MIISFPIEMFHFYWDYNVYNMGDIADFVDMGFLTPKEYSDVIGNGYAYEPSAEERLMYKSDVAKLNK